MPDPNDSGELIDNPYQTWQQIDPQLPDLPIRIWAPDKAHGTHDVLIELGFKAGCEKVQALATIRDRNPELFETVCSRYRTDGVYNELELTDYQLIISKIRTEPGSIGILGYSIANRTNLVMMTIEDSAPSFGSIAYRVYPLTRDLWFYVKKDHLAEKTALQHYVAEFTAEKTWGSTGYLVDADVIPMPLRERRTIRSLIDKATPGIN